MVARDPIEVAPGQTTIFDVLDDGLGELLRDVATTRVLEHDGEWKVRASLALVLLIERGDEFTSETICELAGRPEHPNAVGALILHASKRGEIEYVRHAKATRPNQHAAEIKVWRGRGGDA